MRFAFVISELAMAANALIGLGVRRPTRLDNELPHVPADSSSA